MKSFNLQNYKKVIQSDDNLLVFFTSNNCHLCNDLKPILIKLERKYKNIIDFFIADVDSEKKLTDIILKDEGVPTGFIFSAGNVFKIEDPANPDDDSWYTFDYLDKTINNFLKEK